jgi:hypothetical protein
LKTNKPDEEIAQNATDLVFSSSIPGFLWISAIIWDPKVFSGFESHLGVSNFTPANP